jgi:hypothetical protein
MMPNQSAIYNLAPRFPAAREKYLVALDLAERGMLQRGCVQLESPPLEKDGKHSRMTAVSKHVKMSY